MQPPVKTTLVGELTVASTCLAPVKLPKSPILQEGKALKDIENLSLSSLLGSTEWVKLEGICY